MLKRIKNLKVWLVVLAFLITVGVLFGGQRIAAKFRAENPTRREIGTIKSVRSFSVKRGQDGLAVELKLAKVDNLETVLNLVKQKIELYYNQPVTQYKIVGRPNQKLRQIRYDLSFYLEEAIVSGRYIQLKQALDAYEAVKARAYLTSGFIYIQIEEGSYYLYETIPRQSKTLTINDNQGGGSV